MKMRDPLWFPDGIGIGGGSGDISGFGRITNGGFNWIGGFGSITKFKPGI